MACDVRLVASSAHRCGDERELGDLKLIGTLTVACSFSDWFLSETAIAVERAELCAAPFSQKQQLQSKGHSSVPPPSPTFKRCAL